MLQLALSQRLVESIAKRQVVLVLGTGQELLNLPRARTTGVAFRGSSSSTVLLNRGLLRNRCRFLRVRTGEHAGHCVADRVTDGGTDRDTSCGSGHLGHQAGSLAGGGHRRSNGTRWSVLDHRLGGWWGCCGGLTWRGCRWGSAGWEEGKAVSIVFEISNLYLYKIEVKFNYPIIDNDSQQKEFKRIQKDSVDLDKLLHNQEEKTSEDSEQYSENDSEARN